MKKFKMLLGIVTAILCITSCKRSDADIIFKAQKNSNEKLISEWKNFADDFLCTKALKIPVRQDTILPSRIFNPPKMNRFRNLCV